MSEPANVTSAQEWGESTVETFHQEILAKKLYCALPLPSGRTVLVTRPPLAQWYMFGQLPEALTSLALRTVGKRTEPLDPQTVAMELMKDPEPLKGLAQYIRQILEYAVVKPRIRENASGPNEILPAKVPPGDLQFLLDWVQKGCPGVPVETANGVVSDESLRTFRGGEAGETTPGIGDDVQDFRTGPQ